MSHIVQHSVNVSYSVTKVISQPSETLTEQPVEATSGQLLFFKLSFVYISLISAELLTVSDNALFVM